MNRSSNLSPQVSGNGWYRYSYDIPLTAGGTQYIIFKAVSAYGNNMFLDDFRLTTSLKLPFNEDFDSSYPARFAPIVQSHRQQQLQLGLCAHIQFAPVQRTQ
ncbi:MAG: hypothetical protein LRZ88_07265 [Candidatus Cloacimonetes bacterium]|nr:hypothetical protein [Candidatus Cloacimonadota bacterium]